METEEKLCIKVLRTLQQMLVKRNKYGERVSTVVPWHVFSPAPCHQGAQPPPALVLALLLGHSGCAFILAGQPAAENAA